MSSFSALQSFATTTERHMEWKEKHKPGNFKCCTSMLRAELENGQQTPWVYRCGVGSSASCVWACCESQERKEVLELQQGVDGLCLLPAPCSPPWGWSERAWGAALPAVTHTCWVPACVQGEWKVWVLFLLCHISSIFDNRKASRRVAELLPQPEETGAGTVSTWAGVDQFLLSHWKKPSFHHSHGPPGRLPVEPTARTSLRLAGVL